MSHVEGRTIGAKPTHWEPKQSFLFYYAVIATLSFLVLTFFIVPTPYLSWDLTITRVLQSMRTPWLDQSMQMVGYVGLFPQVVVLNAFIIVVLYLCRLKWESLTLLFTGPVIGIGSTLIRYALDRPRPTSNLVWVSQEIEKGHFGYPSGHSFGFMAIFGFLWFLGFTLLPPSWRRTLLLTIYALWIGLVGLSRVYVGEHWPSDVLGGYLIGSACLALIILFYQWGRKHLFPRLAPHLP